MKVEINTRMNGQQPGVYLHGNDVANDLETINQWLRTILAARRWLKREMNPKEDQND